MTPLSGDSLFWAQALLTALVLGLVVALLVGVLLLANPRVLFTLNAFMSRWVDTRAGFRVLDQPHHLERFFYRHHRVLGTVIVAGATYVLWRWAFAYDRSEVLAMLGRRWVAAGLDWLPAALETAVVVLHGGILVVGLLVMFRPSLLKGLERSANQWQDGPATARLDSVVGNLDGAFEGHPRISGLVLVVSAAWCLLALASVIAELLGR